MIPDGWKLVPVGPTPEMIEAGWSVMEGEDRLARKRYKAMLAASPTPPATPDASYLAGVREGMERAAKVAALLRHLVQCFDVGGESMGRSLRAAFAEEAYRRLDVDHPIYRQEYDACERDPWGYLSAMRIEDIDAIRALIPEAAPGGWRDIATAPKDGTPVLLYFPRRYRGAGGISWGCFINGEWLDSRAIRDNDATHWMPLPAPPETGGE